MAVKRMRLRYAGKCSRCGIGLAAGVTADYDRSTKTVACVICPPVSARSPERADPTPSVPVAESAETVEDGADPVSLVATARSSVLGVVDGEGGASAAAEFERRRAARQKRVAASHPRIGRFLLAVFDDPQSTRAWSVGAEGERLLGEMLASVAGESLRVLNDRRVPRSTANIDHMVVCPSGVFVVDAKRYRGSRPELKVDGGLLRPRVERLTVAGRDRTSLVEGVRRQVALVREALVDRPEVPVRGVLCFVDADWPLIGGSFTVDHVAVLWPKKLKALLVEPGSLGEGQIAQVQWLLHEAFPRQS